MRRPKNTFISEQVTVVHLPTYKLSAFSGFASTYCSAYLFVSVLISCSNCKNVSVKYNSTESITWGLSFVLTFSPSFSLNWKSSIWTCSPTFTCSLFLCQPVLHHTQELCHHQPKYALHLNYVDPVDGLVCHKSKHIYSQHSCQQQHVHHRVVVLLLLHHHCHCHHYYQNFWLFISWLEVYC